MSFLPVVVLLRFRKTMASIPNLSTPTSQDDTPAIVVKAGWFHLNQNAV